MCMLYRNIPAMNSFIISKQVHYYKTKQRRVSAILEFYRQIALRNMRTNEKRFRRPYKLSIIIWPPTGMSITEFVKSSKSDIVALFEVGAVRVLLFNSIYVYPYNRNIFFRV
jgi:hypothetical protein